VVLWAPGSSGIGVGGWEGREGMSWVEGRGGEVFFFGDDVILGNFKRGKKGERGV
jgi:hypothetical protein